MHRKIPEQISEDINTSFSNSCSMLRFAEEHEEEASLSLATPSVVKSMTPNVPQALNEWFDMTNVLSLLINKTSQLNSILTMGLKQKNESYSFISSLLLFLITVSAYDTRLIDGSESSLYPRLLVSGLLSETIL